MSNFVDTNRSKASGAKMTHAEASKQAKALESSIVHSSINPEVPEFSKSNHIIKSSHKLNGSQALKDGQVIDQSCAKASPCGSGAASTGSGPGDLTTNRCSEIQPTSSGL
jgi:hypothetical protein